MVRHVWRMPAPGHGAGSRVVHGVGEIVFVRGRTSYQLRTSWGQPCDGKLWPPGGNQVSQMPRIDCVMSAACPAK